MTTVSYETATAIQPGAASVALHDRRERHIHTPDLTLLIPCHQGAPYIERALRSVVAQDLDPNRFEVLVVFNGEPDGSPEICDRVFAEAPQVRHRYLNLEMASLSNARNEGITQAQGRWVTWVDVDDWLSPNFLSELLACAREGIVALAQVVDVDQDTGEHRTSPITAQILRHEAGVHDGFELSSSLGFAACKLIDVELARQLPFDVELKSGEDVAFFAPFFARFDLVFDSTPAHRGATYFRLVRDDSLSRQNPSFSFSVLQRLAVMRHLERALDQDPPEPLRRTMESFIRYQTIFTQRFLNRFPDEYARVVRAYQESGLRRLAWQSLVATPTTNLLLSYNFPPFADASAVTAAKRAYLSGKQWNVVSNTMSRIRRTDDQLLHLSGPAVATHTVLDDRPVFARWSGVEAYCDHGLAAIAEIEVVHGPQTQVYSRAMWPASHLLAARFVTSRTPRPRWVAEFSDPLRRDTAGAERITPDRPGAVAAALRERLDEAGFSHPTVDSVFAWAEQVAFAFADEVLFTNPHQVTYMLSYLEDARLRDRVRRHAVISPHPTLPPHFYTLYPPARTPVDGKVNIGYFGTFYPNRGMGDVLTALASLDASVRDRLAVRLHTPANPELSRAIGEHGLSQVVTRHDELPYLSMLATLRGFDCLLVTDADTETGTHRRAVNPYLPSKVSDYVGAGVPIWAIVEPASILSRLATHYQDRRGDIAGIAASLTQLAEGGPR